MNKKISKINDKIDLNFLINKKEDIYFERKWVFNMKWELNIISSKILNSIIWMLNAEWWILVLWVNNWKIEDLRNLNNVKFNDFKYITFEIQPPCSVVVEELDIDWKIILIYHIPLERERVFCKKDNEDKYLRVWDETRKLNREQEKKLEYDRHIRRFEDELVNDFEEDDLDKETINNFLLKLKADKKDFKKILKARWLVKEVDWKLYYKNSAILLFSENPSKYIPNASVRYIRYSWIKMKSWKDFNVIKDERFEYNIPTIIEKIKLFLKWTFKDYYHFDIETWRFIKVPEYPEEAWLEWIVNALTHRSYNIQWNSVYINHFDDRIEVFNSWPLPSIVTVQNIKYERYARNPFIARTLYDFWYVREQNEWAKRIYKAMEELLLPEPLYEIRNDNVILTLRNKVSWSDEIISEDTMKRIEKNFEFMKKVERNILSIVIIEKKINLERLSNLVWLQIRSIRRYLNKFIELWIIEKVKEKEIIFKIKK